MVDNVQKKIRFSAEQENVIAARGNMLVSASAGSGKTTVMIEKIKRLIEAGAKLEEMLIATYTVSAAADMRAKLAEALENGKNPNCAAALETLPEAQIGTLHSICAKLIQNKFYLTDVDPAFTMLGEVEAAGMKAAAIERVLSGCDDARFAKVYDALLSNRSDKPLKKLLTALLEYVRTQPDPEKWLDECLALYTDPERVDKLLDASFAADRERLIAEVQTLAVDTAAANFTRNLAACKGLRDFIDDGIEPNAPRGRVGDEYSELNERYKSLRASVKAFRKEVDEAAALPAAIAAYDDAQMLVGLMREILHAYDESKARQAVLDYGDLEHKALEILRVERPAYRYVFVDEYQDVNPLQEQILNALSRDAELFEVGDVKQSIYAFRLSTPEIFLERSLRYAADSKLGRVFELNANYRSDGGILAAVNAVFDRAMTPDFGGVDYARHARLVAGRNVVSSDAVTCKIVLGDDAKAFAPVYRVSCDGESDLSPEARLVALDILALREKGVSPDKIVVLMRSRSQLMYEIAEALERLGIESAVCATAAPAHSDAVRPLVNALRLIDNRDDDVILAAVLLSPFGGFTLDDLSALPPAERLIDAIAGASGAMKARFDAFFDKFDRYERLSAFMPADELAGKVASEAMYFEYLYALPSGRAAAAELGVFLGMMSKSGRCASLREYLAYADSAPAVDRVVGAGAVKLMTVHASKGLEFDYVFFAGTEQRFRLNDAGNAIAAGSNGLTVRFFDADARAIEDTKLTLLDCRTKRKRMLEEELRILYVALTRAKERLYIYGKRDKKYAGESLSPISNLNFLLPALSKVEYIDPIDVPKTTAKPAADVFPIDSELKEQIETQLGYSYARNRLPRKSTVTREAEKAEEAVDRAVVADYCDEERIETSRAPKPTYGATAAEIGTAYHLMMEHIDFDGEFPSEWARLEKAFPRESALVNPDDIRLAVATVGEMIKGHDVYREKEFIIDAGGMLVQGVIDLLLVKGNEAVVLDYKTTRAEDLILPRYERQTELYATAVEKLLGLKVTRVCLYSFYLGRTVDLKQKPINS